MDVWKKEKKKAQGKLEEKGYKKYVYLYKYKFRSNRVVSYIKEPQTQPEAPQSKNTKYKGYTSKKVPWRNQIGGHQVSQRLSVITF